MISILCMCVWEKAFEIKMILDIIDLIGSSHKKESTLNCKKIRYRRREITIYTKHTFKNRYICNTHIHATHTYMHQKVRNKKRSKIYFRAYSLSYEEIDMILKTLSLYLLCFTFILINSHIWKRRKDLRRGLKQMWNCENGD